MHAETARHRHRIDQPRERRAAGQREVVALGVIRGRDAIRRHAGDAAREAGRMQAGGVHQQPAAQRHRIGAADIDLHAASHGAPAGHRTEEHRHRAGILRIALQRQHVGVAVDDAGDRRQQRAGAAQVRLHRRSPRPRSARACPRRRSPRRGRLMPASIASSSRVGRDDQLAAIGDAARPSRRSRHRAPCRPATQNRAMRLPAGIVDAGVDHLAVARATSRCRCLRRLEDDHLAAGQRQRARHRQADDAGAHHDAIDPLHTPSPCWRPARFTLSIRLALGWTRC